MHKAEVPEERLLNFLIGKVSLEECLGKNTWMTRFVVETSTVVEYYEYSSHFLSKSLVTTLSTIFKQGYFESAEKSHSKMRILMGVIERNVGAVTLNLTGADLSGCSLQKADLSGADLSRANLSRACLYDADLSGANLSESTLFEANFEGCNLTKANFSATMSRYLL
jgi:uncharacterized protein YjbI with pentapeptide repeats